MVNIGSWMGAAWDLFAKQWGNWLLLMIAFLFLSSVPMVLGFVAFAILMGVNMTPGDMEAMARNLDKISSQRYADPEPMINELMKGGAVGDLQQFLIITGLVVLFTVFVWSLIVPPLTAGIYRAAFNQMRTGQLEISDLFMGFEVFWPSVIGMGVVGLLIAAGLCLCIVPGLYIAITSYLMLPLLAEKRQGFRAALRDSRRIVRQDFWSFALYFLLGAVILGISSAICGLLVLVTSPLMHLMLAVAVRETVGEIGRAHV